MTERQYRWLVAALVFAVAGTVYGVEETSDDDCTGRCAARADSIERLERALERRKAEIEELRLRADSLTEAYEGRPRWER